ncbi:SOS response-associated peptidase [Paenibacillus cremeus]|uniref:Abasic site processing protein n=1 Tax=Paenibacillus cremeus TaxID=2163881 RepID=A0A559KHF2_9BACL|nr:SOS response-associated peptidase [Paenibacillus cremeus]TVY11567.1 SOS response-associated peptidase [Paenibacillus cremeus]
MCGRYTITAEWEELMLRFLLDIRPGKYQPRYNAAPGQWIPAIIGADHAEAGRRMGELRWGLVPSWSKDDKSAFRMINARSETVAEKPAFRSLLARKRCIVPADGFYEWKVSGKTKQPMRFRMKDRSLFGMAALYDTWQTPDGSKLHTCTILTTSANTLVSPIHERMPVILNGEAERLWLNRRIQEEKEFLPLLSPYPAEAMEFYAVDPKVGRVQYDEADCIEPIIS